MKFTDFAAYCGNWPFYSLPFNNLEGLSKLHMLSNIDKAFVSSLDAIFYSDPFSADVKLAEELTSYPQYRHAICVNPKLDNWRANLERALETINVSAVRIYPCIHGYSLSDECAIAVADALSEAKLPVLVSAYLIDPRLSHMIPTRLLSTDECAEFMRHIHGIKAVFCGMKYSEIVNLADANPDALFDMSGLRDNCFPIEQLCERKLSHRIVYGSGAPLSCISSTLMQLTLAEVPDKAKYDIAQGAAF